MIYYYFTSEFFQQLVTYYSCIIYRFYVFSRFFFHYVLWKIFLFPTVWTPRLLSRRKCTHLLLRELQNYNSLLNNHQLENVGSHQKKKKISYVQGQRRSPSKMVGGEKSHLESNCNPPEMLRGLKQNLVHTRRSHRNWDQTCLWVFDCLL